MRLRECSDITIDNKSVERIKMFGDIVWEKTQATTTTLTITPAVENTNKEESDYIITKNYTFTLKATTVTAKNSLIQNGTIIFSDIEHTQNGNDIVKTYNREIKNNIAEISLQASSTGIHTYTATFQPATNKYKTSSSEIKVKIKKDTPKIEIIGETTVYNGWDIGAILTSSNGTLLSNKLYRVHVHGADYENRKTTEKGRMYLDVMSLPLGKHEVIFHFYGDNEYESVSVSREYIIKADETVELSIIGQDLGYKNIEGNYQQWKKDNANTFSCYKNHQPCEQTNTIGTGSGLYNHPSPLIVHFSEVRIQHLKKMTLKFDSNQLPGCNGSDGGGWLKTPPNIGLSINNAGFNGPDLDTQPINFNNIGYYGSQISTGPISQSLNWSSFGLEGQLVVTNQVSVRFDYPPSSGIEEGFLILYNVRLIVSYIPPQPTEIKK